MNEIWIKSAQNMANIAANITKHYFRKPLTFHCKQDGSFVSNADLEIETALRHYLQRYHPDHGVLGEELGENEEQTEFTWVLDPIDGTSSFLSGKPTFCTLIALLQSGKPILGLLSQPILGEQWLGIVGQPTLYNGLPILTNPAFDSTRVRFNCTTPHMFRTSQEIAFYQSISKHASITTYGGDGYAYGLLAMGLIDVIVEADLAYYDIAALIPIVEGVGGAITDWQGRTIVKEQFNGQVLAVHQPSAFKDWRSKHLPGCNMETRRF